jgi:hypothetical protein
MDGIRISEVVRCEGQERVSTYFNRKGSSQQEVYRQEYLVNEEGAVRGVQALFDQQGRQKTASTLADLSVILSDKRLVKQGTEVCDRGYVYSALEESGAAFGWVGKAHLTDYFQEEGTANGSGDSIAIASRGPLGSIEMSLSATHNYLPSAIRILKHADSLYGKEKLASAFVAKEPPSNVVQPAVVADVPAVVVGRMEWEVSVGAFDKTADQIWYPSQMTVVQTVVFSDGRTNVTKSRLGVVHEKEALDACAPRILIPKGYSITIENASQLPYRWNGTDSEPGVPELPLYERVPVSRLSADGTSRTLLLALNIALLGLLFLVVLYRRVRGPGN